MDSVKRCQKLPLCWTEPVPAGSKMDPPLAKAKPVSHFGSTSYMITYLRIKNAVREGKDYGEAGCSPAACGGCHTRANERALKEVAACGEATLEQVCW